MLKRYGYIWVTLLLFLGSMIGYAVSGYADGMKTIELINGFFENSQSEFLQLIWQVLGLKFLLCWGSPTSREGQDRLEAKVDQLADAVATLGEQQRLAKRPKAR